MSESEIKKPFYVEFELGALWHSVARWIAEIPFSLRALWAKPGVMVRDGEIIAQGKIVRYSGDINVILTKGGYMVFPNTDAHYVLGPPLEQITPSKA